MNADERRLNTKRFRFESAFIRVHRRLIECFLLSCHALACIPAKSDIPLAVSLKPKAEILCAHRDLNCSRVDEKNP